MSKSFSNIDEMNLVYETSKEVFEGKISAEAAAKMLEAKTAATNSSLKMYFHIFACMRKAECYKMGTGAVFTRFLLERIYEDYGLPGLVNALSAVKGNSVYREVKKNAQPGLEVVAREVMADHCPDMQYESIPVPSFDPNAKKVVKGTQKTDSVKKKAILTEPHSPLPVIPKPKVKTTKKKERARKATMVEKSQDIYELNIQPAASILNVFSRLSYKPWYAIAEFVDNSTQSYLSHSTELTAAPAFTHLIVEVEYDAVTNTLTIFDNAYGMEIDRFQDAVRLDSRNEFQTGRNEFGMGLKTAASWFGNIWSVTSTQYGSTNMYAAVVDIPRLKESGENSIEIHRSTVQSELHGTWITIKDVTKKITGSRTIGKIRTLLSSMYRRDINQNNIEIRFNGEPIVFEEYPILQNYRGKTWKKELDFDVPFEGKKYNVTGFVAIMNPGSFPKAGFSLFRQNRVVVGGLDSNYKPNAIFGQAQSQKSLKLFGELNMNDFPVNQAKDGFIWDDGLEDAFIDALKANILEYIEIAEISIKERAQEEQLSDIASDKLHDDVSAALQNAFNANQDPEESEETQTELPGDGEEKTDEDQPETDEVQEYIDTVLNAAIEEEKVSNKREYVVTLAPAYSVKLSVQWARGNNSYWIEYAENEENNYDIIINIDHPFFMPFAKEEGFHKVLEKFTVAFVLAEVQAKLSSGTKGYVRVSAIKNAMNKYLEQLSEES